MALKNFLLYTLFIGYTLVINSQTASVEKATYGIQTGFLGIWGHNESKLFNSIALRTEIGFDSGFWSGSFYKGSGFLLTPVLTLEPRWYYNLHKRVKKSRRIDGNSGNFVAIKTSYHPDWFVISNVSNIRVISDISIIPTWGIRRNVGKHVTYETGIGMGYRYTYAKQAGFLENESELTANVHLRIGYRF